MKRATAVLMAVMGLCAALVTTTAASAHQASDQQSSWIVVLEDGPGNVKAVADGLANAHGGSVGLVYEHALEGFSVQMSARGAAALARNPRVAYVEPDHQVQLAAQDIPTGIDRTFATDNANLKVGDGSDERVDVDVAVIDTGIDFDHPDLNVVGGVDCSGGGPFGGSCSSGGDDDHYHGTHVAGSVAAIDNGDGVVGMAPGARLHAVKVLGSDGRGYESWIVAGIDWVAANADTIEVANMSLGGSGFSQAEYDAIQGAVNNGVAFAVAAGNDDDDANNYSPASFDNALTVSALADFDGAPGGNGSATCRSDQDDTLADFSNWGDAVDIAAPGVCILSTYPIEQGSYGTISGTSMASPHAAGALALLASSNNPGNASDVHGLYDQLTSSGNFDWTDDSGDGIHEPLLDVSTFTATFTDGGGGGGDNTAPTASIDDVSCTDLACDFAGSGSDADGDSLTYSWDFGDGATASGTNVSHTYAAAGDYTVTLTVSDGTATGTDQQLVTVSDGTAGPISLSVSPYKVKGRHHADLTFTGATTTAVDVFVDGSLHTTTANDGAYTWSSTDRGGGSHTFQVCEAGTSTCSDVVTATW